MVGCFFWVSCSGCLVGAGGCRVVGGREMQARPRSKPPSISAGARETGQCQSVSPGGVKYLGEGARPSTQTPSPPPPKNLMVHDGIPSRAMPPSNTTRFGERGGVGWDGMAHNLTHVGMAAAVVVCGCVVQGRTAWAWARRGWLHVRGIHGFRTARRRGANASVGNSSKPRLLLLFLLLLLLVGRHRCQGG